ncbi:hypothetical protein N0V90_013185 [Kalmusia sp. IMI 367209]|nr:hypothetical protein N0V90_013185 [Kalmusia sp. IMI 367209]
MASTPVQKVALLGKGFLGTAILEQLTKAGFTVTVITRSRSSLKNLPSGVQVAEVDYASLPSLVSAFEGQDAVVAALSAGAVSNQKLMIDAAIQAGVRRFVPSDYGAMTTDPAAQALPVHALMVDIQNYLKGKAEKGEIEWTLFSTGPFLDLIMGNMPFVFDVANKEITWYDDGEVKFSTTSNATIGKAIAAALKNPLQTKNRNIFIHDAAVTQKQMVALVKKYVPGEWKETKVNSEEELRASLEAVGRGEIDMMTMLKMVKSALLGGKYRTFYEKVDNEMLGLGVYSDMDLEAEFEERFK